MSGEKWQRGDRLRANARLVEGLLAVWERVPDQRFGQLVMNLAREPGGFADTWEWGHQRWWDALNEAASTWANGASDD